MCGICTNLTKVRRRFQGLLQSERQTQLLPDTFTNSLFFTEHQIKSVYEKQYCSPIAVNGKGKGLLQLQPLNSKRCIHVLKDYTVVNQTSMHQLL